jgi:hypothetical protein
VRGGKPAAWVRQIKSGRSGVYEIRRRPELADDSAGRVLYVGESHTGRLRKTMLRHFQTWDGPTAGPTCDPTTCEVAIRYCPPSAAPGLETAWIAELDPRDNRQKTGDEPAAAEVPF